MGNFFDSLFESPSSIVNNIDDRSPDRIIPEKSIKINPKHHLIRTIISQKSKRIYLPDNFQELLQNYELKSEDLLSMSIELYEILVNVAGDYQPPQRPLTITKKFNRAFYVKPNFTINDVINSINMIRPNIASQLDEKLITISIPDQPMMMPDITLEEYDNAFNILTLNKDMMGISKKILKDIPIYMKLRFIKCFNQILENPTLINVSSIAKGKYEYKVSKKGPTDKIDSFRKIMAIPNVINHFHRILKNRLCGFVMKNQYINTTIQKGGIGGQTFPLFQQFFKLKNVLKEANQKNKSCVILFLDFADAFGSIKLENLYQILHSYNVDNRFINYLKHFYGSLEYFMDVNQITTDPYSWIDGLIQGCSLSPILFMIILNYFLVYIDGKYNDDCGYAFDSGIKMLLTAYVDDIGVSCRNISSAHIVFEEFNKVCNMAGLNINKSKCAMMIINDNTEIPESLKEITVVNNFKYLGENLSSDGTIIKSFNYLLSFVINRLKSLDKKTIPDSEKKTFFINIIIPWIQKKMITMYDIDTANKYKLSYIMKPYMDKWGIPNINLFGNINQILQDQTDPVVKHLHDNFLPQEIKMTNIIFGQQHIHFKYNSMDDEKLETILNN